MSRIMKHYFDYEYNFSQGTCLKILLGLLALPIDSIISILWLYVVIPYVSFKRALQSAILGKKFDNEDIIHFDLPIVGIRALPQLILAAIFAYTEYPRLSSFDEYFGIPVPMTIISIALSGVCLFIGIITGFIKVRFVYCLPVLVHFLKSLSLVWFSKLELFYLLRFSASRILGKGHSV